MATFGTGGEGTNVRNPFGERRTKQKRKGLGGQGGSVSNQFGGQMWSIEDWRWFPKHHTYKTYFGDPPSIQKGLEQYKVRKTPDFKKTAHSGLSSGATITTSEGVFGLGKSYESPFLRKIKRNKRILEEGN